MALWTDSARKDTAEPYSENSLLAAAPAPDSPPAHPERSLAPSLGHSSPPALLGWPIPSSLVADPEEARARIPLPEFDELLLEKARVISGRIPFAEAEY